MHRIHFSNGGERTEITQTSACCFAKDDLRKLGIGWCEVIRDSDKVLVARYEWKGGKLTAWVR